MATMDFLRDHHVGQLWAPVADAFTGGRNSDIIAMRHFRRATFFVFTGAVEDAAVSNLVTIEACDDISATNKQAMAFYHRVVAWDPTNEVQWGALTSAAAAGFNFSDPNSDADTIWMCEVTAEQIADAGQSASTPFVAPFVRMVIAETVDKTITAGGVYILSDPRYPGITPPKVQA